MCMYMQLKYLKENKGITEIFEIMSLRTFQKCDNIKPQIQEVQNTKHNKYQKVCLDRSSSNCMEPKSKENFEVKLGGGGMRGGRKHLPMEEQG